MRLSDEIMRAMGMRPFAVGESVQARFTHLTVLAIEGITIQSAETTTVNVNRHACRLAIASNVNSACQALLDNDYVENESEWEIERKCSGPYVLVAIGPTEEYEANAGWIEDVSGGDITTYDCFASAKANLREIADEILPELVTAITCSFFMSDRHFRIRPVDNSAFGTNRQGRTVHDIRMNVTAHAHLSFAATSEAVQACLASVVAQAPKLDVKVARFFSLAMIEEDDLKRFLYFFLALEVKTHATFGAVDHSDRIGQMVPDISLAGQSVAALLQRHTENMRNLRDRFVWCSLCAWTSISDDDIAKFKQLKDIRDAIAHGSIDAPPNSAVTEIQALTIKVLQQGNSHMHGSGLAP